MTLKSAHFANSFKCSKNINEFIIVTKNGRNKKKRSNILYQFINQSKNLMSNVKLL